MQKKRKKKDKTYQKKKNSSLFLNRGRKCASHTASKWMEEIMNSSVILYGVKIQFLGYELRKIDEIYSE